MSTDLIKYNIFKEKFNSYKIKYKNYIILKKGLNNREDFKKDTLFFINNLKNLINYSINFDMDEDEMDEDEMDDEYEMNNDDEDDFFNLKFITNINKVERLINNDENNELLIVLEKIIYYLDNILKKKNSNEIIYLEKSIYKLQILLYIKNITKYLDIVKKNFNLYCINYNFYKNDRDFVNLVKYISLLAENYKCIYSKYHDFCDYFSNNYYKFNQIRSLVNKIKQSFILILKDHTNILKKYS